jgi:hypothetical protein
MVTVARCFDLSEAIHLRMLLEASGIPAFVPDEASASVAPHHFLAGSGVRVQVPEAHAEDARRIIEEDRQGRQPPA